MAKTKTDGRSDENRGKEILFPIEGSGFVTLGQGLQSFYNKSNEKMPPGTLYAVDEKKSEKNFKKFVKEIAELF